MADAPNNNNPPPLPQNMPEEWSDKLMQQINAAIGARLSQSEKKRTTELDAIKGEFKKMFEEFQQVSNKSGGGKNDDDDNNKKNRKEDLETATLRRQLEEQRMQLEALAQREAASRQRLRDSSMKQQVFEILQSYAVNPIMQRSAYALFRNEDRLAFEDDDSDQVTYRGEDGIIVKLADGLKAWAKTEEGKTFLPAINARGSGSRPGSNQSATNSRPTESEIRQRIGEALERVL